MEPSHYPLAFPGLIRARLYTKHRASVTWGVAFTDEKVEMGQITQQVPLCPLTNHVEMVWAP